MGGETSRYEQQQLLLRQLLTLVGIQHSRIPLLYSVLWGLVCGLPCTNCAVFNRDYKAQLRGRWTVLQEQYSWWGQTDTGRSSTLNAVLARNDAAAGGADAGRCACCI